MIQVCGSKSNVGLSLLSKLMGCGQLSVILLCLVNTSNLYRIETPEDALDYLSHFGYLDSEGEELGLVGNEEAKDALKDFQDTVDVRVTGKLDEETMVMMNRVRCGNRDERIEEGDEIFPRRERRRRRQKRNESPRVRWKRRILTYRVTRFASSHSLKPKSLQREIDLAFKYWEREANLTFKKIWEGKPDIEVAFVKGDHGDEESFDGPSNTLAHAFYPQRGDIHFDDDEKWTADTRRGHNLRTVAVHEIGHSLGLGHSTEKNAVMYLMYQGFKSQLKLHEADINGIQKLYGPKFFETETKDSLKDPVKMEGISDMIANSKPDLCSDSSIDAISTLDDRYIYIFKGNYYFRLDKMGDKIHDKYPKLINETFKGVRTPLDTVLTLTNGKTYFFKGKKYWRSTGTKMDAGYPKNISSNFPGIPNHLDASFVWSWNNRVYFFKKNRYWRFNFEQNQVDGNDYPKSISTNWPGIPDSRIEDSFRAPNGRTYFFKKGEYWQFHDPESDLEAAAYPRSSLDWWFGCTEFKPDFRKVRHMRRKKNNVYI